MIAAAGETTAANTGEGQFARYASGLWPSFAEELEGASAATVSYIRNGAVFVVGPGDAFTVGEGVSKISADAARTIEPMLTGEYDEIFWAPDEAQVDNRALGPALTRALVRAGGRILRESAIMVETKNGRATGVRTGAERVNADAVVMAAGAWCSHIGGVPEELRAVRPIKGEMIALAGVGGPLTRVVRSADCYLVPRGARIFVGATVQDAGFDTSLTPIAARQLQRSAVALVPALAEWSVVEHWTGFRPRTPDDLPVLGPTSVEGLFAATGQFRNGILFAPALAEVVSRAVLDRQPVPIEFSSHRFATGVDVCA
jgi:glycine/D-amino acid oxidase-like deaminating enzyme